MVQYFTRIHIKVKGDTEQEYTCLKEACPLWDAAYGPEHPRAAAARKRLADLNDYLQI